MTRFNSVFSLSNIAATFTDSHSYPASKWVVNGVTPSNYMMCYHTIDECIEIAGIEQDDHSDYTPKQIQEMCGETAATIPNKGKIQYYS